MSQIQKPLSQETVKRIGQWLANGDTGVSSETMVAISMGAVASDETGFDAPYDPSDFGRCYKLVKAVPELRDQFKRIGEIVPTFAGILQNWDELCETFERDAPKGRSDDLYSRIKELRGDCNNHPVLVKKRRDAENANAATEQAGA